MKKLIALLMTGCLVLGLVGCADNGVRTRNVDRDGLGNNRVNDFNNTGVPVPNNNMNRMNRGFDTNGNNGILDTDNDGDIFDNDDDDNDVNLRNRTLAPGTATP